MKFERAEQTVELDSNCSSYQHEELELLVTMQTSEFTKNSKLLVMYKNLASV